MKSNPITVMLQTEHEQEPRTRAGLKVNVAVLEV